MLKYQLGCDGQLCTGRLLLPVPTADLFCIKGKYVLKFVTEGGARDENQETLLHGVHKQPRYPHHHHHTI